MKAALRLRRPAEYARVQRFGSVYRHPALLISVYANELSHNRYGIVTGKRLGVAVTRNRCKRRLRALLSELHSVLRQGFDVVVIARRKMIRQPFSLLLRILRELFVEAQLLGNH